MFPRRQNADGLCPSVFGSSGQDLSVDSIPNVCNPTAGLIESGRFLFTWLSTAVKIGAEITLKKKFAFNLRLAILINNGLGIRIS